MDRMIRDDSMLYDEVILAAVGLGSAQVPAVARYDISISVEDTSWIRCDRVFTCLCNNLV